jgi:hypothetical protein
MFGRIALGAGRVQQIRQSIRQNSGSVHSIFASIALQLARNSQFASRNSQIADRVQQIRDRVSLNSATVRSIFAMIALSHP